MSPEPPELVRAILVRRGVAPDDYEAYFNPRLSDLSASRDLPGVADAVRVILASVRAADPVVVFGDYDCDGVCATAIVTNVLRAFGAQVAPFVPERLTEGYGMTAASVVRMLAEHPGVRLVVTVDNGINSVGPVALLRAHGIRVVVTDHHLPGDVLPDADALVNPKVAAPPRLGGLCGAGVAFHLANALVTAAKAEGLYAGPSLGGPLLVLAGLATVTDIMPLVGENRTLVAEALRHFDAWAPMGLRELYAKAARAGQTAYQTRDFSFVLGPRINAAGRMASGTEALNLILATDREVAREAARQVDLRNVERKQAEIRMAEEAERQVVPGAPAQVIDIPDGHPGVSGIVASRLLERADPRVPVCIAVGPHGSARAPEGYNLRDAFAACGDDLRFYGGHAAAGGFSVKEGCMAHFREHFCAAILAQRETILAARPEAFAPPPSDAVVRPDDLSLELAEWVARMEPFGEGNPEPVFEFRNVYFDDVRTLGQDGRHLLIGVMSYKALWWCRGGMLEELRRPQKRDIRFTLSISDYGVRHLELIVKSVVPSAPAAAEAKPITITLTKGTVTC